MTGSRARAVVTGAAGFLGSHLCERLIADGWDVVGVDGFTDYYERAEKEANLAGLTREPAFALIEADVVGDSWRSVLAAGDTVFHLAAQPGVRGSFGVSFARYARDNLLATQRVFEAALAAGVPAGRVGLVVVGLRRRSRLPVLGTHTHPSAVTVRRHQASLRGPRRRVPRPGSRHRRPAVLHGVRTAPAARHGDAPDVRSGGLGRHVPDLRRRLPVPRLHVRQRRLRRHGARRDRRRAGPALQRRRRYRGDPRPHRGGHRAPRADAPGADTRARQRGDVRRTAADTSAARRDLGWRPLVDLDDGLRLELDWVRAATSARRVA